LCFNGYNGSQARDIFHEIVVDEIFNFTDEHNDSFVIFWKYFLAVMFGAFEIDPNDDLPTKSEFLTRLSPTKKKLLLS